MKTFVMNKRLKSFVYAINGIRIGIREPNMLIHLTMAVLVVFFGFLFGISVSEWLICILCFGLVMGMELINTAIEKLVDLVSPEYNKLAGKIKDIAAGAVLIAAVFAAVNGLIIFIPKAIKFFCG
ncbi:MAG: diacylglycerol kinase family protein [Paludibacter sp.]|nr:diacylglycerol kinase family protein [Paludibacter sp.]